VLVAPFKLKFMIGLGGVAPLLLFGGGVLPLFGAPNLGKEGIPPIKCQNKNVSYLASVDYFRLLNFP
jgi:hypothetical protein